MTYSVETRKKNVNNGRWGQDCKYSNTGRPQGNAEELAIDKAKELRDYGYQSRVKQDGKVIWK